MGSMRRPCASCPSARSISSSRSVLVRADMAVHAAVALAIRIESGAGQPILYRQERVGERGRVFRLIKFRSMRTDAEKDGVARWADKDDDRVTRVGRFIRARDSMNCRSSGTSCAAT